MSDSRWDAMLPGASWPRRRETLRELFETIAPSYDRLNHWLSLGLDRYWRTRAAREAIARDAPARVLDLASGTGDQAAALRVRSRGARVIRLDLSPELLRRGEGKVAAERRFVGERASADAPADLADAPADAPADLANASADAPAAPPVVAEMERLPFRDGSFDAITMAFALRHVESLDRLMDGCARALRAGGRISFVDMALPSGGGWARIYLFYFRSCLPRLAALFGGDRRAYEAMVRSVESFPGWDKLEAAARKAGLTGVRLIPMTRGAAQVFFAER